MNVKFFHALLMTILLSFMVWQSSCPLSAWAQPPLVLDERQGRYPLVRTLEYLEDPGGVLTFADVSSPKYAGLFVRSQHAVPSFGHTDSVYWVRFRVRSAAAHTTEWRLELNFANTQDITCYRPRVDRSGYDEIRTGSLLPFHTREVPYHHFVFSLLLPPDADQTVYLRVHSKIFLKLPLTLWSTNAFLRHAQRVLLLSGAFYGALLIVLGYNGFLWLALRVRGHLYYVLFVASFGMMQVVYDGFAMQYFRPHAVWSNPHLLLFLLICVRIMALKFVAVYLGARTRSPFWHRTISGMMLIWGIIMLLFPVVSFGALTRATMLLGVVNSVVTFSSSVSVWRRGYKPMRFFLISWLVFMVTTNMFLLERLGLVPASAFSEHSYQFGFLLMAILLAVAFAERVQLVQQEKALAQVQVMTALLTQERLVREQNTLLERKVAERTAELQEYRDHLEERVQEELSIRQQQERLLIQKSKLESLGVLAAGIAHEINQPLTRITFGADSILLKITRHEAPEIDDLETKCGTILESVDRISRIIDHIRTFSRDQHSMRAERIDVRATIQNALSLVRTQYQHHNILIRTDLQATGWVMGNQYKLEQVILNLLSNAKDAIETHTDAISAAFRENAITIRTFDRQEQIIIEVADTGAGITEETLPHIFDPFFTTKAVGQGTGLGLSISYGIIKDMRGDMSAASDANAGTIMTIALPRMSDGSMSHKSR